ncbi:hypothetical protein ANANG_G00002450 [Anguilla anguilla]|uniref:UPAR/Ly6 domain-containing protein n=1 Tax=Anguilla anguilla TaxID=7936 RepID=A0A9D3MYB2_ANGAN|nr:hypothetical protein ANANG_G00002450 [Anguilla anguilla]
MRNRPTPIYSEYSISCVKCLDDGCLNATKGWRSQNGTDDNVWDRNGSGNSIPVCGFYSPPSETWYHVCQKNHTVFMVTNDSEAGVSFALEASGKDLKFERKTGNECPTLEPEPPTTGHALECYRRDIGFHNSTKTTCSPGERCFTGVGQAAQATDVVMQGCLTPDECNRESTVEVFSPTKTTYAMKKTCCATDLCNPTTSRGCPQSSLTLATLASMLVASAFF